MPTCAELRATYSAGIKASSVSNAGCNGPTSTSPPERSPQPGITTLTNGGLRHSDQHRAIPVVRKQRHGDDTEHDIR
jgi:hypothetical protein